MNRNLVGSIYGRFSINIAHPPNIGSFWQSSFREEDFWKSTNHKQALPMAAMFVNGSKRNEQSHRCFLPSFIRNLVGSIYGRFSVTIVNLS
jgi:hypothetical protein